ncbi:MAG: SGNH/GDSL hydrolase family protein [Clostridia bacterium]|nr:SGNH/GDSL hydrolase family protein [Clostridia bacterium]
MKKERFEWIHSWCDYTERNDLPRVLLIGDSITHGYQTKVRELLAGKYLVDYIATSYSVDCVFYNQLISAFAADSKYDVIHFNHGLHGGHMTTEVYASGMDALTASLSRIGKVILVTSTKTYNPGTDTPTDFHTKVVERNAALIPLAEKYGCTIDDLYAVSASLPLSAYSPDGTHFAEDGYTALAKAVAESILAL